MVADIRITDVRESSELHQYALRRLRGIVRDPRSGIEGVSLSINRAPGPEPKGVRCQILVRVSPRLSLSVERSEASAHAAIDAAADRLGWALGVWHGQVWGSETSPEQGDGASDGIAG
jgi:ribosome-associated translation inhibitor RaiA